MTIPEVLGSFPSLKVLVVGDLCLDRWCTYDPALSEPSRETSLSRLAVVHTESTPGAAGTVASNLVSLGVGTVSVMGCLGNDGHGQDLMRALSTRSISAELSFRSNDLPTFTYTKFINHRTGEEDQPRVDYVYPRPLPADVEDNIVRNLRLYGTAFDVIIVSDQVETDPAGTVTPRVRGALTELAQAKPALVVWVDSRRRLELFRCLILKPNEREAAEASHRLFGRLDYRALREHTASPLVVVTRGAQGALVVDGHGDQVVPAPAVKPVDICGAGDGFSAGAASAYAVSRSPVLAARVGNLVASVTIQQRGTGTATPEAVLAADRSFPA